MLIPSTAAIALVLSRHDRSAGAAVMIAVAVKFTAILLLPFLLIGGADEPPARSTCSSVRCSPRSRSAAMYLALFGLSLPNLVDQSTLLTPGACRTSSAWSSVSGGGTPGLLRAANVALIVVIALLLRRNRDWISDAGWSTLALVAALAWLVPWYVIWVLPLAALGNEPQPASRRAHLHGVSRDRVRSIRPECARRKLGINLMNSPAGQASTTLQRKLAQ